MRTEINFLKLSSNHSHIFLPLPRRSNTRIAFEYFQPMIVALIFQNTKKIISLKRLTFLVNEGTLDVTSSQQIGRKRTHGKSFFSEQTFPIDLNSHQNIVRRTPVSDVCLQPLNIILGKSKKDKSQKSRKHETMLDTIGCSN